MATTALPPILAYTVEAENTVTLDKNLLVVAEISRDSGDERILDVCYARSGGTLWQLIDVVGGTSVLRNINPKTGEIINAVNAEVKLGFSGAGKQVHDFGCGQLLTIENSTGQVCTVRVSVINDSLTPDTVLAVTSITSVGTTATVTTTLAHGYSTGMARLIQGADQDEYNGSYVITVTGPTTFTYTFAGSGASPATGTITVTVDTEAPENDPTLGLIVTRFSLTLPWLDAQLNSSSTRLAYALNNDLKIFDLENDADLRTVKTFGVGVCLPCWLSDGSFVVMGRTGSGSPIFEYNHIFRVDPDGKQIIDIPPDPAVADLLSDGGVNGMVATLDSSDCVQKTDKGRGLIWLAGDHDPNDGEPGFGVWNDGFVVIPIRLTTGEVLPYVIPDVGTDTDYDEFGSFCLVSSGAYSSASGDPTDNGLPPKPDVHCGPVTNIRSVNPNPGCNAGGVGFTPEYTGPSGTVPECTDPTDEETLTGKRTVHIKASILHTIYNADTGAITGTEYIDVAQVELDDTRRAEGRIRSIGDIRISSSDNQGSLKASSADIYLVDTGRRRPIGERLVDPTRKYFNRDEVTFTAQSDYGRANNLTPRALGRGLAYGGSYGTSTGGGKGVEAKITTVDQVSIEGGSFDPDKKVPQWTYPMAFYTDAPPGLASLFMPVILGEVSDNGAKDPVTGLLSERGKCPIRYVGMDNIGSAPGGEPWGRFNLCMFAVYKINSLYGSDLGAMGLFGRAALSNGVKPSSSIILDGTGDLSIVPTGGWAQIVLFTKQGRSEHRILKVNPGAHSVKVDGVIDPEVVDGTISWYISHISYIPRRVKIDLDARNGSSGDCMVPKWPSYIRANPYEEFTSVDGDYRVTDLWVRGPLLEAALANEVSLTCNVTGVESVGDGSGLPIIDYYIALNWIWDNMIHRQLQAPLGGLWPVTNGDVPLWQSDGLSMTRTTSFTAAQALSASMLGGYGLRISAWIGDGGGMRDFVQLLNDNGGCRHAIDEHGRVTCLLFDIDQDTSTWPHIEHISKVFGSVTQTRAYNEAANYVKGGYDWDPDGAKFRDDKLKSISQPAINHNKGKNKFSKHVDLKYLANKEHAQWILDRKIFFNAEGPIYVTINSLIFGAVDYPVGTGILLTSVMGPGALGYVAHPMVILDKIISITNKTVEYFLLDVGTDGQVIPISQQFLITNVDGDAPLISNDSAEAPIIAA